MPGDIGAVSALARRAWLETYRDIYPAPEIEAYVGVHYSEERLAPFARPGASAPGGKGAFTVAVLAGEIAGFCHAGVRDSPDDFWLHRIYVEPALKGRGIGHALLADMEARLRTLGAARYSVECHGKNASGLAFYAARGFAKLRDEGEDVVLEKGL